MARDNIFPFLRIFAKGYGKGNEPRVAVVFTFILCEICLFIGSLEISSMTLLFLSVSFMSCTRWLLS